MCEYEFVPLECVLRLAERRALWLGLDDDQVQMARVNAWRSWDRMKGRCSAKHVARWAVASARAGRCLSGLGNTTSQDKCPSRQDLLEDLADDRERRVKDVDTRDWVGAILAHADAASRRVARAILRHGTQTLACGALGMHQRTMVKELARLRCLARRLAE